MTNLERTSFALSSYLYAETLQAGTIRSFTNYSKWCQIDIHFDFGDEKMLKQISAIKSRLHPEAKKRMRYYLECGYMVYSITFNM